MNQRNPYHQYGYDNYDQPVQGANSRRRGILEKVFGQRLSMKFKNPLFATTALLLSASAFAAVIVFSYPEDASVSEDVPVIRADKTAFKEPAGEAGLANVPFQDSTIFSSMRDGQLNESAPVENLLAQEQPVDRFSAFDEEAARAMADEADEQPDQDMAAVAPSEGSEEVPAETDMMASAQDVDDVPAAAPVEIKKIVQKTEKISGQEIAQAQAEQAHRPQVLHAPASSPETLAFVRSVLDKKDAEGGGTETVSAGSAAAAVEPAAGAAIGADIQPGGYYVQLASVTSSAGAKTEWGKLQKTYAAQLQNVSYRVQEANLGERGTFYRIQAGPMSKDSANSICDAIKAQKPGACLVVK